MQSHKFKNSDSWNRGQGVEALFGELLKVKHPEAHPSEFKDQVNHIDWFCSVGSIDVKAMKRVSRSSKVQSELIWVEFKGNSGRAGWLYGKQDWVAFEQEKFFLIVRRPDLAELCENICDLNTQVDSAGAALYKSYSRKGRQDIISMIKFSDILKIEHFKISKNLIGGVS